MISLLVFLILLTVVLGLQSAELINEVLIINNHGDYMNVPDSDSLDITGEITIEARIRLHDDKNQTFFRKEGAYLLEVEGTNLWFCVSDGGVWKCLAISTFDLELGIDYHIAVVYNQEVGKIFINGELDIEENRDGYTGNIAKSSSDLAIGYWGEPFVGWIDEARTWNIARTQTQIQESMNQPLESPELQENLVGYWNFDSRDANDLSQYENHGKLCGDARISEFIIYVSIEGNDTTGDGTFENPYRTIQKGINESRRNDIVQVLPGIYEENIELLSDLIVLGSGSKDIIVTSDIGSVVTANNAYNVSLSGFTIDGKGSADGLLCSGATFGIAIKDNIVLNSKIGIWCSGSANANIKNNVLKWNVYDGLQCGNSTNVAIDDNDFKNNGRYGIWCYGETTVNIISNSVCDNNEWGIRSSNTAKVTIQSNTIDQNGQYGILCEGSTTTDITANNILYNSNHGIGGGGNAVITVSDNLIHNNVECGMMFSDAPNVTIVRNTILGSASAIDIREGSTTALIGGSLIDSNNIMY